ncbi:ABC transporter ATP-binding protein [Halobaculum sp. MBLA0143]|uniref:ABC transporter ATP-binding protein n=1 Tax=Halobaculum sp. MBLA0143 TaxID=3079933 RepID=UPI0035234A0E
MSLSTSCSPANQQKLFKYLVRSIFVSRTETAVDEPIVSVRGLKKEYGDSEDSVIAVDDVSFEIDRSSITGLLGHNGAGKTTVIKSMLGLVRPTDGKVQIDGFSVDDNPKRTFARVSAVLEGARTTYWRLTVRENVRFFSRLAGHDPAEHRERHEELYEAFGLEDKLNTTVNELSRGMKQKAGIVTALARRPDVLFLDEPTLGLDVESSLELRRQLTTLVGEGGLTVIVSSHDMEVIEEICNRVIVMSDGEVIADESVDELMELFDRQNVALSLSSADEATLSRIRDEFDVVGDSKRDGHDRIEVSIEDTEQLHSLLGRLVEAGVSVTNIETTEVDFSEVYLEITDGDEWNRATISGKNDA